MGLQFVICGQGGGQDHIISRQRGQFKMTRLKVIGQQLINHRIGCCVAGNHAGLQQGTRGFSADGFFEVSLGISGILQGKAVIVAAELSIRSGKGWNILQFFGHISIAHGQANAVCLSLECGLKHDLR